MTKLELQPVLEFQNPEIVIVDSAKESDRLIDKEQSNTEKIVTSKSKEVLFLIVYEFFQFGYLLTSNQIGPYGFGSLFITIVGNLLLMLFVVVWLRDGDSIKRRNFLFVFGIINCINGIQIFDIFGSIQQLHSWSFKEIIWMCCALSILIASVAAGIFVLIGIFLGLKWCVNLFVK